MTVAMAFFSIAMTLDLMGVKPGSLRLADLKPSQIGNTLSREFYGARSSVVRYYDNVRFVYQLQSRMRELRRDVETQPQQQQQQQQQTKQNGKNGSAQRQAPERGAVLRAGQRTADSGRRTEEVTGNRLQVTEQGSEPRAQSAEEAAVGLELVGTGKRISLGQSRTGLQEEYAEGAWYELRQSSRGGGNRLLSELRKRRCARSARGMCRATCIASRVWRRGVTGAGPGGAGAYAPPGAGASGSYGPPPMGVPNPGTATILGFIPGVGAMYNGQYIKAIVHVLVFVVLISITEHYGLFGIFAGAWVLYQVFDAHQTAKARRDGLPLPGSFWAE